MLHLRSLYIVLAEMFLLGGVMAIVHTCACVCPACDIAMCVCVHRVMSCCQERHQQLLRKQFKRALQLG